MPRLWSFDPGGVTGVALGWFDDNTAYRLDHSFVIPSGVKGFSTWMWEHHREIWDDDVIVSEKFELNLGNEFKADLTPLQIEGILIHHSDIVWQLRGEKAGMDLILKRNGLWVTGKDVGWEDGRDANDAVLHALIYLRRSRHKPTLREHFRG